MDGRIIAPICPLFDRPEPAAERVDEALCGMAVTLLSPPEGGWCRVKTRYGYEGYAREELLAAPGPHWAEEELLVLSLPPCCDILAAPRVSAPILATLPRGSIAAAGPDEGADGWRSVTLPDGQTGYAKARLWEPLRDTPRPRSRNALRRAVCDTALRYLGAPYRWGGKTPGGIDCSGLTFMAYWLCGVTIFRDARMEEGYPVHPIPREALKPADLLYWPGHVALYIGNGRYVHATAKTGSDGVVINSLDPQSASYRPDLAENPPVCGSIFP